MATRRGRTSTGETKKETFFSVSAQLSGKCGPNPKTHKKVLPKVRVFFCFIFFYSPARRETASWSLGFFSHISFYGAALTG
jgi:hypothetical protein